MLLALEETWGGQFSNHSTPDNHLQRSIEIEAENVLYWPLELRENTPDHIMSWHTNHVIPEID
jgi:hypothetical protein